MLVNLTVNTIQAMPEGNVLTLTNADWTAPDGRPGLRIGLADTGPGLAKALIGELFKPFVTRKQDGTGLGLWISRSIVDALRWRHRCPQPTGGAGQRGGIGGSWP